MFNQFLKKDEIFIDAKEGKLYAPITGYYIPVEQIPDEVFSQGILGPGCGIEPLEGKVYAPVNGIIIGVADTKHAIGIRGSKGEELLVHVGMDTVVMNGKGFKVNVNEGENVRAGHLLMQFDMEAIKNAGHSCTTAFVLTNSDDFESIHITVEHSFKAGEEVGKVE